MLLKKNEAAEYMLSIAMHLGRHLSFTCCNMLSREDLMYVEEVS